MLVAVVLASALLHAAWNALLRRHPDPRSAGVAVVAIAAITALIVAACAFAWTRAEPFPSARGLVASVVAGLFEAAYFASLARGLVAGPLGPVYTISRGGAVLLVWPLSIAIFGERAGLLGAAGSALLLVGLGAAGMERRVPRVAALWGVATAACIAGYHLVYKVALDAGAAPPAVFAVAVTVAAPAQALANRITPRAAARAWREAPGTTTAAGVLCTISFVVFLVALRGGGAGAVLTLRNTSVVFALVFASFLGERASPRQILGAALVVAGAVLVGLG